MTECCCCISPEKGYKVTGLACCFISFLSLAQFIYSYIQSDGLNRFMGGGFLVAYGIPAYYWFTSQSDPDQLYKRRFAKTYIWITSIWWLVLILFLALIVTAFSAFGGSAPDGL